MPRVTVSISPDELTRLKTAKSLRGQGRPTAADVVTDRILRATSKAKAKPITARIARKAS